MTPAETTERMREIVAQADSEALDAFARLAVRAKEVQRLEAAKDKQRTLLQLATTRMAWTDAKHAVEQLEALDAELVKVRKGR